MRMAHEWCRCVSSSTCFACACNASRTRPMHDINPKPLVTQLCHEHSPRSSGRQSSYQWYSARAPLSAQAPRKSTLSSTPACRRCRPAPGTASAAAQTPQPPLASTPAFSPGAARDSLLPPPTPACRSRRCRQWSGMLPRCLGTRLSRVASRRVLRRSAARMQQAARRPRLHPSVPRRLQVTQSRAVQVPARKEAYSQKLAWICSLTRRAVKHTSSTWLIVDRAVWSKGLAKCRNAHKWAQPQHMHQRM